MTEKESVEGNIPEIQDISTLKLLISNPKAVQKEKNLACQKLMKINTPEAKSILVDYFIKSIKLLKKKEASRDVDKRRDNYFIDLMKTGTKKAAEYIYKNKRLSLFESEKNFAYLDDKAQEIIIQKFMKEYYGKKPYLPPSLFNYCEKTDFKSRKQVLQALADGFLKKKYIQSKSPEFKYILKYLNDEDFSFKQEVLKKMKSWLVHEVLALNIDKAIGLINPNDKALFETLQYLYQKTDFKDNLAIKEKWTLLLEKFAT
ncbi:hypothetical protein NEF87_004828 [Candidatus Lokiarchaeum ossiferum]|uniref:HEAT repeat domain-containing protein n=1 Tax=Candidatus Lokiarchaeum ossiferum TaxID=2951803 RepID=A0ABY6HYS8_9ARCH|nr:hypothetical protein NEF87_004828 [Candidatus Lokiarchaeum sp. B-35]